MKNMNYLKKVFSVSLVFLSLTSMKTFNMEAGKMSRLLSWFKDKGAQVADSRVVHYVKGSPRKAAVIAAGVVIGGYIANKIYRWFKPGIAAEMAPESPKTSAIEAPSTVVTVPETPDESSMQGANDATESPSLESLSDYVLLEIMQRFPDDTLGNLAMTNRRFSVLAKHEFTGRLAERQNEDFASLVENGNKLSLPRMNLKRLYSIAFRNLTGLRWLDLTDNKLQDLPENVFENLGNLEILYLGRNQIEDLSGRIFGTLSKLEWLVLAENQLSRLPEGIFSNLRELYNLNLRGNQLRELPTGIFQGLKELELLFLSNNQLEYLSPAIFQDLPKLKELHLNMNPLSWENVEELQQALPNVAIIF